MARRHLTGGGPTYDDIAYPRLFVGTRESTRCLALIALNEPILSAPLGRALGVGAMNTLYKVRRLMEAGLVARFHRPSRRRPDAPSKFSHKQLALDPHFAAAATLLTFLIRLADIAGESAAPAPRHIVGERVDEPADETGHDLIFGTPARTTAIVLAHALGRVDWQTLSQMMGTAGGNAYQVLDPLVRDGILTSYRHKGHVMAYEIEQRSPWSSALNAFLDDLVNRAHPRFAAKAGVADVMRRNAPRRRLLADPTATRHNK